MTPVTPPIQLQLKDVQVTIQLIKVLKWQHHISEESVQSDVLAWMVRTTGNRRKAMVWADKERAEEFLKLLSDNNIEFEELDTSVRNIIKGQALRGITTVGTCGGMHRPRWVFRAIHKGTPKKGLQARNDGTTSTDAIHLQIDMKHHLNWQFRGSSVFLSTTSLIRTAAWYAAFLKARGHRKIEILVIDTHHPSWDHDRSRMWHSKIVADMLGVVSRWLRASEYLIENSIPKEAVRRRLKWDEVKDLLDPDRILRIKARDKYNVVKEMRLLKLKQKTPRDGSRGRNGASHVRE